jgi:general secretion pathway protein E
MEAAGSRFGYPCTMVDHERLIWILDLLVEKDAIHSGQKQDVLNRGRDQARHILLDKRAQMRRMLGRHRVAYRVSSIELIASFRFQRRDQPLERVDESYITEMVAEALDLPFVQLDPLKLDYGLVTNAFGGPFAERHLIVAIDDTDTSLTIAMADPWDKELVESIARVKNKRITVVVAAKSEILGVIVEFHGFRRSMRAAEKDFASDFPDLGNLEQLYELDDGGSDLDANDKPIVRAVWYLLNYAFEQRASDIHLEPKRDEGWVRVRIDGVLHQIHRLPKVVFPAMVSRFKMLARMDIAERRRPQDGRFKTSFQDEEIELRVSTIPTVFGEKVVARVFDPGAELGDLESLGFFPRELATFKGMLAQNSGLILVVGPTGSGKTTTLYTSLLHIHSPRVNIVTIEDPIEMVHEELNQIAMQPKIGLNFGSALRNVLRQDPDVVMVGEIRDEETAQNAVQAALTGHLVISTIHTIDVASAVGRMLDLGVLPFLLSSVLVGVVAQRLVRKICPQCAVDDVLQDDEVLALRIQGARGKRLRVRRGVGCVKCRYTGYRGRTGLYEVMPVTTRIGTLVHEQASSQEIKREALNDGMLTLREYGIKKIAFGETSFDEVMAMTDDRSVY